MDDKLTAADVQAQSNKRIAELENAVAELTALVEHYKELFKLSQHKRFGASSEKSLLGAEQLSLAGNAAPAVSVSAVDHETETVMVTRNKKRVGKRKGDLSKLPIEIVEHTISEAEHNCPEGYKITEIGTEIRDEIAIEPARVFHRQHRIHVYKYEPCGDICGETIIVKARMPDPLIKGSVASASVVAHVMTQKHLMHLPFYRQEQDFLRKGVFINRQNMANWSIQVCEDWLSPIRERLKRRFFEHDVGHADETVLQVLCEPGKTAQSKSYMAVYRTSGDSKTPVVIYEYQPNRRGEHPETFLNGWHGYLHTDGYAAYHNLDGLTVVGCWAHLRRKFDEAYRITKAGGTPAAIGHDYCDRLFSLEREFADLTPEERFEARLEIFHASRRGVFRVGGSGRCT